MHLVFLTPSPGPPGGGTRFNAGLIPALRSLGHTVEHHADARNLPDGARPVIDGLLLPTLEDVHPDLVARDAVVIVHHLSAAAGQDRSAKDRVRAQEQRMLPGFRTIIATSAPVAERLASTYGLAAIATLAPGAPDLPRTHPARSDNAPAPGCHILSAGVLTPRKGHDRLLHALARLTDLDWTLTIAGDAQRDPVHAATIAALVDGLQLAARVTLLPDASDHALEAEWARADLFALASSWEGHPAGIAEALRRGIPVLATAVGEVAATVPHTAGVICPPDDPATFGKCLRRVLFDTPLREALAEGAWQAGLAMPGWPQQALAFLSIIER